MGRFLTRDTWDGYANRPLSLNRWAYSEGNPINLTDPSGNDPNSNLNYCLATTPRVSLGADLYGLCFVEAYMKPNPSDHVHTYVAAGVAIESNTYGPLWDTRNSPWWWLRSVIRYPNKYGTSLGICNISDAQMETEWGQLIMMNGEPYGGYGLGMPGLDQEDPYIAIAAMRRRILLVIDNQEAKFKCNGCSSTDKFIAAALAEGSNLFQNDIKKLQNNIYHYKTSSLDEITLKWHRYITNEIGNADHNFRQIRLFYLDVKELLKRDDWAVPDDLNWPQIQLLSNGIDPRPNEK